MNRRASREDRPLDPLLPFPPSSSHRGHVSTSFVQEPPRGNTCRNNHQTSSTPVGGKPQTLDSTIRTTTTSKSHSPSESLVSSSTPATRTKRSPSPTPPTSSARSQEDREHHHYPPQIPPFPLPPNRQPFWGPSPQTMLGTHHPHHPFFNHMMYHGGHHHPQIHSARYPPQFQPGIISPHHNPYFPPSGYPADDGREENRTETLTPPVSSCPVSLSSGSTTNSTTNSSNITPSTTTSTPATKTSRPRRRIATIAQRRAANIRERRRMFNLNSAFDRLRKKVPTFAYEKRLSRIDTLRLAMTYIRFMTELLSSPVTGYSPDSSTCIVTSSDGCSSRESPSRLSSCSVNCSSTYDKVSSDNHDTIGIYSTTTM